MLYIVTCSTEYGSKKEPKIYEIEADDIHYQGETNDNGDGLILCLVKKVGTRTTTVFTRNMASIADVVAKETLKAEYEGKQKPGLKVVSFEEKALALKNKQKQ